MSYICITKQRREWVRAVQISNPSELDFAEVRRHCRIDQAGNLMLNFLQLPFKMNSSTSPTLTRESRRSILPFTSQDLNSQSHTWKRKNYVQGTETHSCCVTMEESPALVYIAEFSISEFWIVARCVLNFVNLFQGFSSQQHDSCFFGILAWLSQGLIRISDNGHCEVHWRKKLMHLGKQDPSRK